MDAFNEWWEQASTRDQLALLIGGGFLVIYILFMAVLSPVSEMREKELIKNNALRASLENVRELAAKVVARTNGGAKVSQGASIENVVQQSVSTHGLDVASMNASGKTGVRLRFEEARFENVLKWLYEMEVGQNMKIKDLSVATSSTAGLVTVNLRLHKD